MNEVVPDQAVVPSRVPARAAAQTSDRKTGGHSTEGGVGARGRARGTGGRGVCSERLIFLNCYKCEMAWPFYS